MSLPFRECVGVWNNVSGLSLQDGALMSALFLLDILSCRLGGPPAELGTSLNICANQTVMHEHKQMNKVNNVYKVSYSLLCNCSDAGVCGGKRSQENMYTHAAKCQGVNRNTTLAL